MSADAGSCCIPIQTGRRGQATCSYQLVTTLQQMMAAERGGPDMECCAQLQPCCSCAVVFCPIPLLTWMFPCVGHVGELCMLVAANCTCSLPILNCITCMTAHKTCAGYCEEWVQTLLQNLRASEPGTVFVMTSSFYAVQAYALQMARHSTLQDHTRSMLVACCLARRHATCH